MLAMGKDEVFFVFSDTLLNRKMAGLDGITPSRERASRIGC
jgi:hypothetical protein